MTGNYADVHGVEYLSYHHDGDGGDEPDVEGFGRIDEMYITNGQLYIGIESPEAFHSVHIPIHRSDDWVELVQDIVGTLR